METISTGRCDSKCTTLTESSAFTENFDDSARVSVTPILSNTNLGSRGAASTLIDDADSGSSWNTRTFGNYDFAGGGWFDVTVELDEKGRRSPIRWRHRIRLL
jgi:hypothetical protein